MIAVTALAALLTSCGSEAVGDAGTAVTVVRSASSSAQIRAEQQSDSSGARPLSNNSIGARAGVQVQPWYISVEDLKEIRDMGFSHVRWGVSWEQVETSRGVYDWSKVDQFVSMLNGTGLKSIVILGLGNRLYSGVVNLEPDPAARELTVPAAPETEEARTAFARFARAAAERYRARPDLLWEIWNEPDHRIFWAPTPNPNAYAQLADEACRSMKAVNSRAVVFAGAGASLPDAVAQESGNLYSALLASPARSCIDHVSSHAYRMGADYDVPQPDSAAAQIAASRRYLSQALGWSSGVLAVTEWGWPTNRIAPSMQLAYMLRGTFLAVSESSPVVIWYEWKDSRDDTTNPESSFGLKTAGGDFKSSDVQRDLFKQILDSELIRKIDSSPNFVQAFLIRRQRQNHVAAWVASADASGTSKVYVNGAYWGTLNSTPQLIPVGSTDKFEIRFGAVENCFTC